MTRHYLDILADVIRENWDKPALTDYATLDGGVGNSYTYGQMYERILALCDRFRQLGLNPGDHIAICGENSTNWAIAYLAVAAYRGVSVAILHSLPYEDIVSLVKFSDAKLLLIDRNILQEIAADLCEDVVGTCPLEELPLPTKCQQGEVSFSNLGLDLTASIFYTSGSTGVPKGVMLSTWAITKGTMDAIAILPDCYGLQSVCLLPLAHMTSLLACLLAQLLHAHHIFFVTDYSLGMIPEIMGNTHSYTMVTVPLFVEKLCEKYAGSLKQILGSDFLQFVLTGAMFNPMVEDFLFQEGIPTVLAYGSTESMVISGIRWEQFKIHTSGTLTKNRVVKFAPNGEILTRGKDVMLGYYKNPEATAEKFDNEGWFHTGDRGHLDEDGYLYVEGRLEQDMIVLPSGENISPAKVEAIINACDGVEESIVIARNGKLLALVVMKDFSRFSERSGFREQSEQEFRNHLLAQINPQLPAYSQLFGIEFLSAPLARTEKKTIKRYLYK